MIIAYISILLLAVIILFLSLALYILVKRGVYFTEKEKEYIIFVVNIFKDYGDDLGIQTKEQHQKLVQELDKIINKHFKIEKNDKT